MRAGEPTTSEYRQDKTGERANHFGSRIPPLKHLEFSAKSAKEFLAKIRSQPVTGYQVGDKVYVDIRCYSTEWYDSVLTFLTDRYDKLYVVMYEVVAVTTRAIKAYCPTYVLRSSLPAGSHCRMRILH